MDLTIILMGILTTAGAAWLGGIQLKVRQMDSRLLKAISRDEVRELVQDKLEVHTAKLEAVKEDIEKVMDKLDRLLENK